MQMTRIITEHYFATYLTNPKELCGIIKKLPNSKSPGYMQQSNQKSLEKSSCSAFMHNQRDNY
jgi:hypothetical protein